jgi:hypothetical protein
VGWPGFSLSANKLERGRFGVIRQSNVGLFGDPDFNDPVPLNDMPRRNEYALADVKRRPNALVSRR